MNQLNANTVIESPSQEFVNEQNDALAGELAQNVLPILTLDKLDQAEQSRIIDIALEAATEAMNGFTIYAARDKYATELAVASGTIDEYAENLIPRKLQEARKLFCATLFELVNKVHADKGEGDARLLASGLRANYFGAFPDMVSYAGGLADYIELLSIVERGPITVAEFGGEIYGDVTYEHSFTKENLLPEIFKDRTSIEQMKFLPIVERLANYATGQGDWANQFVQNARQSLGELADDSATSPLVRLGATKLRDDLWQEHTADWVFLDELPLNEQERIMQAEQTRRQQVQALQDTLHQAFPSLPQGARLARIAPDVAATINGRGQIDLISDQGNNTASLLNWHKENDFSINRDQAFLLGAVHNPALKEMVNGELGMDITDLPLEVQKHLMRFMIESDEARYGRFARAIQKLEDKTDFATSFLSLEFGDDFGDRLLDIVEKFDHNEATGVLLCLDRIRQSAKTVADNLPTSDDNLRKAYETAWIKRATEMLATISSERLPDNDRRNAIATLGSVAYAAEMIAKSDGGNSELINSRVEPGDEFYSYRSDNGVIKSIRTGGSSLRIGNTVRIPDEYLPKSIQGDKNNRLNIRLDYDEYGLSLDIGSGGNDVKASSIGRMVAEYMATGELELFWQRRMDSIKRGVFSAAIEKVFNGNHVREAFDGVTMDNEKFQQISKEYLQRLSSTTAPERKEDIT